MAPDRMASRPADRVAAGSLPAARWRARFHHLVNSAGTAADTARGLSSGLLSGTLGRLLGSIFERFVQVFRVTYPVCAA
ncbi:conserved hypothetical protein [Burkholderia cenocepacia]|nr:conserved hypothetical protein [Burkholderia cenocepacia]